ncbi:MAG: metal ABC transporter permease [Fimbriimonadaceae bacterium]|nr:metal ABC transporter permease [Fimbriimonadaceae bacterium]
MQELLAALSTGWVQRALLAGVLVAVLGGVVGFYVVLRRMAFVAVGISHAALGGVALGVLFGQSPIGWAIVFSIVVALGMAALGKQGMHEDTAMGIFFPAAMAFGVVVMSFSAAWQRDLMSYLFGNILGVSGGDLYLLGAVTLIVCLVVGVFFKELLFVSFDEESAHASGVPVAPMRTILLVVTAVTVVVTIKVVGSVLVSAMLVVPAATMSQLTGRWQGMLLGSIGVGIVAVLGGFALSYQHNVATGPAAVLVATGLFAVASLLGRLLERQRRAESVVEGPVAPVTPLPRAG